MSVTVATDPNSFEMLSQTGSVMAMSLAARNLFKSDLLLPSLQLQVTAACWCTLAGVNVPHQVATLVILILFVSLKNRQKMLTVGVCNLVLQTLRSLMKKNLGTVKLLRVMGPIGCLQPV